MMTQSLRKITGHSDVKGSVSFISENVNKPGFHSADSRFRGNDLITRSKTCNVSQIT